MFILTSTGMEVKMNKQISGVLLLSLLAASCNSEAPVEANAESETIQNYQLAITDSYGV